MFDEDKIEELMYSDEYANYIMTYGDMSERIICNGDTLTEAMEDGYLFEQFLESLKCLHNDTMESLK